MKLIATWTQTQDETTEAPIRLTWEDGTPATASDWSRADSNTQSFGYNLKAVANA